MKLKSLLFSSLMLLGGVFSNNQVWALEQDGSGVYQIGTAQDLIDFANMVNGNSDKSGSSAELTADINLEGKTYVPIGVDASRYYGTFDGKGHRIKNMSITGSTKEQGMFNVVSTATIKNLILDSSCNINSGDCTAALIGCCNGSGTLTIENVGVECNVTGTGPNAAAFVGCNYGGGTLAIVIKNCYNTGNVTGGRESAVFSGWFGNNANASVINCWNTGKVEGQDSRSSLGRGISDSQFVNTYDLNSSNNGLDATKLTDYDDSWKGNGHLCYELNKNGYQIWHQTIGTDAYPVPFSNGHGIVRKSGESYVQRTLNNNYYELGSAEDLNWFAEYVNTVSYNINGKLTTDIDYRELTESNNMIGRQGHPYHGTFDGQGHTVTVAFDVSENDCGLFRRVNSGTVKNLKVTGSMTTTGQFAGGIVSGIWQNGTIENCISDVTITDNTSGDRTHGGVVARISDKVNITIRNCSFTGTINASTATGCGGIVGWPDNGGSSVKIQNCLMAGTLNLATTTGQNNDVIVRNSATVTNCYYTSLQSMNNAQSATLVADGQLTSGELCYLLNESVSGGTTWYQALGVGGDAYPQPIAKDGATVYVRGSLYCDGMIKPGVEYVNVEAAPSQDTHSYTNGLCTNSHDAIVCNDPQSGYVTLTDSYYQIGNALQLKWFAFYVNKKSANVNAKLTADIDFDDVTGFPGIGTSANKFRGVFDGQKHRISNLNMSIAENAVGLFRYITSGGTVIKCFTIDNSCSFTGVDGVGAFVGQAEGRNGDRDILFEELGNEADVTASGANGGGILGVNQSSDAYITMKNCYNTGAIASSREGGALSGWLGDKTKVINCYNMGAISGGEGLARANSDKVASLNLFSTENTAKLQITGELVTSDAIANGTVFTALHDYTNDTYSVDGSVWQMEFSGTPHPVLYDAALVFDENFPNRPKAGRTGDVTLYRTIKKDGWNTFCVPFDMNNTQITTYFGASAKVAMLDETKKAEDNVLHFKTLKSVDNIEAGQAYLVYPDIAADFSRKDITNVTIEDVDPEDVSLNQAGFAFTGVFERTALTENEDYIVASGQKVVKTSGGSLNGFRAYFKPIVPGARATSFVIDDEEVTGIITLEGEVIVDEPVYNLNGVRVAQPTSGMYVKNGKKYIQR